MSLWLIPYCAARPEPRIEEVMGSELSSREELLSIALAKAPCGAVVASTQQSGEILYINSEFTRVTGYGLSDIPDVATWLQRAYPDPDYRAEVMGNWERDVTEPGRDVIYNVTRKDGEQRRMLLRAQLLPGERMIVMILDVSEHVRVQDQYRESEERYRNLIEALPLGVVVHTRDSIVFVNQRAAEMMRAASPEELVGRSALEFVHPDSLESVRSRLRALFEENQPQPAVEEKFVRLDGTVFDAEVLGRAVDWHGQKASQVVFGDITGRKESQRKLIESELRFSRLAEAIDQVVWVMEVNPERCVYVSPAWARIWGSNPQVLYDDPAEWSKPILEEDRAPSVQVWRDCLAGKISSFDISYRIRHTDGGIRWIEDAGAVILDEDGHPHAISGIAKDVTQRREAELERQKLERRIQNAQKLESLAVMAGGVAHDFNNLLLGILGFTDLALMDLPVESPVRGYLDGIESSAQSAADLARQMLAYAGKGSFVSSRVNVRRMIEEVSHLVEAAVMKRNIVRYHFSDDAPTIQADPTQFRQVIMNLVTNAAEAIGDKSGHIDISTGVQEITEDSSSLGHSDALEPGTYAFIEVSDDGAGMDSETCRRVFDPFFTTKLTGHGLGLAAVSGIVKSHHGMIDVVSEPGRGTTFKVLLPAIREGGETVTGQQADEGERGGSGKILLVDDDETARIVVGTMLRRAGYDVILAEDGLVAVTAFERSSSEIDCVILDLVMPRMDGVETYGRLHDIRPDIPVLLSSGFDEKDALSRFSSEGLAGYLQKPYKSAQLFEALHRAMRRAREGD